MQGAQAKPDLDPTCTKWTKWKSYETALMKPIREVLLCRAHKTKPRARYEMEETRIMRSGLVLGIWPWFQGQFHTNYMEIKVSYTESNILGYF